MMNKFFVFWISNVFILSLCPLGQQSVRAQPPHPVTIYIEITDSLTNEPVEKVGVSYKIIGSENVFYAPKETNNKGLSKFNTPVDSINVIISVTFSNNEYIEQTLTKKITNNPFEIKAKLLRHSYPSYSINFQATNVKKNAIKKAKFKLCGSDTSQWIISDKKGQVKMELHNFRPMQTYPILVKRRGYRRDTFFYHLGGGTNLVLEKRFNRCDTLLAAGVLLGAVAITAGVRSKNFHDDYNIITNNINREDDLKKANCWSKISFVSGVASALAFGGSAWCYCRHHKKMHKKHKPRKA